MDSARLAELLAPFLGSAKDATPGAENLLRHISTYIDILLRWNARMNLTAIRDPEEIVTRHFGESLFAARHLFPANVQDAVGGPFKPSFGLSGMGSVERSDSTGDKNHVAMAAHRSPAERSSPALDAATVPVGHSGRAALQRREKGPPEDRALAPDENQHSKIHDRPTLADLGSGAGFPGIPIKLWAPHLSLTLIESNHKKTTFLREVARALTLTDINIQNVRAETLSPASFDVVTLRAVESFEAMLPVAANLIAPTGRLALLIGSSQLDLAIRVLNSYSWFEPLPIPHANSRILAIARRRT
jgi:16S rRNA (guanine(527)-N(7))-methyltransferase RsmG